MPVRFKGLSEYDRNFKWRRSYDSSQDPIEMSKWAGLRSDELGITKEPNFPSKRKVPYHNTQVSKSFQWKENDEYAAERMNLGHNGEKDSLVAEKTHTPDAPRLPRKSRSRSAVPRMQANGHSAVPRIQSADGRSTVPKIQPADDGSAVPRMQSVDGGSAVLKVKKNGTEDNKAMPASSKSSPEKEVNGFHRVLQKKAGLNIAPSHHPLKLSEYRRQFERKSPTENSPLLAAEQVIHNKNQSIPPFKLNKVNTETEYNSQFKGSPPVKGPKLRKNWEDKHLTEFDQENHSPKRKDKKKKICEVESGSAKVDKPEIGQKEMVQRKIKEKILQGLNTPSKCYRNAKTEYSAHFLSPSEYNYKDGAWVRAKHRVHDQGPPLNAGSMWVAEVKELREKAEYYRRRARGTHFSREHLNQILSTNNRLWDVSSTSSSAEDMSSNIKALDLAGLQTSSKNEKIHRSPKTLKTASNTGNLGVSDAPTFPVRRKLVWDEYDNAEPTEEIAPLRMEDEPEEASGPEEIDQAEDNTAEEYTENNNETSTQRPCDMHLNPPPDQSECTSVSSGVEGRLPTPKLKTYALAQRTHHDLTTPATGGALLVSPTKHNHHTSEHKHKGSSKKDCSPNMAVSKDFIERKKKKLVCQDEEQSVQSPLVAGLMTVDPLPLREDPWLNSLISNKPSSATISYPVSRHVEKPIVPVSQQRSTSCRIHGSLRDPEFQHNGNFNIPSFYNAAPNDDNSNEDDRLSQISARSAASSSLASLVLERAQRRKEHFWGKK